MMYFGPCKESQRFFEQLPGVDVSSSSPADFIIIVASELANGVGTCELTLQEVEGRAREHMKAIFPDISMRERHPPLHSKFSLTDRFGAMNMWRLIKHNVLADIEDIKKSAVTIQILLIREFLKEMRRWKYWATSSIRAIIIGCMLGG